MACIELKGVVLEPCRECIELVTVSFLPLDELRLITFHQYPVVISFEHSFFLQGTMEVEEYVGVLLIVLLLIEPDIYKISPCLAQ